MGEKWRCTRGILIQKILLWHTAALIYQSQAGKPFSYFHKAPTMSRAGSHLTSDLCRKCWQEQSSMHGEGNTVNKFSATQYAVLNTLNRPWNLGQARNPAKKSWGALSHWMFCPRSSLCFIRGLRKEAKLSGGHKDYPQWLTADGG